MFTLKSPAGLLIYGGVNCGSLKPPTHHCESCCCLSHKGPTTSDDCCTNGEHGRRDAKPKGSFV